MRKDRRPSGERKGRGSGEEERHEIRGQWGFLVPYLKWLRKSSFILILVLGRNHPARFHGRELARSLGYDVSTISRNLKQLEEMGLVTHEGVGNLVLYQADMTSALLRQMKIWFTLLELRDLIRDLDPVATNAILYGSCARGEDTYGSDIDLFIEAPDREKVREILGRNREGIPRELSAMVNTPDDTYRLKSENRALFENIQRGISLKG